MIKYILTGILLIQVSTCCMSQYRAISGHVMDSITKKPIPYASIVVSGGYQGTATNTNGAFDFIFDCADSCSIKITSLGYYSSTVSLSQPVDTIWLKPATKILEEIVIKSRDVNAFKLVKKAIKSIKKNYITDPFVINGFFRHYCRDSSVYTRLVEAAVDLYQPKGYRRAIMKDSVFRGQLRLLQTRRMFKKRDNGFHSHIAVRSTLADDLIGAAGLAFPLVFEVNEDTFVTWPLDMLRREYEFSLNKVTFMDGKEVYEIDFSKTYYNENVKPRPVHKGKIFISSTDFAILRYEYSFPQAISKGYTKVIYKRYFDKYALFSIEKERNLAGKHVDHMIFQNTNITLGKSEEKYSNNISRAEIAKADYDPDFWNSYNGVKRNRLEETIVKNLNAESSMSTQEAFEEEQSEEYKIWREEERHGAIYDSLLENNQGLLCTIFWRSSHLYSKLVVSDYQKALNNIKILKAKGVRFVFVSLDYNHDLWKERIVKYGLENENHLRIGYNKKDKEAYHFENIVQLPQYQIHYKKRTIEYQAPPIYKDDFLSLIDKYLNKIDP